MHDRYRNILGALWTVGIAGVSAALALPAQAKTEDRNVDPASPSSVANRLQEIRDAVSAFDPTGLPDSGMSASGMSNSGMSNSGIPDSGIHGAAADPDIQLAWWGNGNGRGWGNGGRRWANGPGPRWPNGGWHNWHNGHRHWVNF